MQGNARRKDSCRRNSGSLPLMGAKPISAGGTFGSPRATGRRRAGWPKPPGLDLSGKMVNHVQECLLVGLQHIDMIDTFVYMCIDLHIDTSWRMY